MPGAISPPQPRPPQLRAGQSEVSARPGSARRERDESFGYLLLVADASLRWAGEVRHTSEGADRSGPEARTYSLLPWARSPWQKQTLSPGTCPMPS